MIALYQKHGYRVFLKTKPLPFQETMPLREQIAMSAHYLIANVNHATGDVCFWQNDQGHIEGMINQRTEASALFLTDTISFETTNFTVSRLDEQPEEIRDIFQTLSSPVETEHALMTYFGRSTFIEKNAITAPAHDLVSMNNLGVQCRQNNLLYYGMF